MSKNPVFVDNRVVGSEEDGVFVQRITQKHIFIQENAKGIDVSLFQRLKNSCHTWRLVFKDTGQVLSIPFDKIEIVGNEREIPGAGRQIMVKLEDFNEDKPAVQKRLL